MHIVESGLFVARSSRTLGHVLTVNVFTPWSVFGELALLSPDSCRSATLRDAAGKHSLVAWDIRKTSVLETPVGSSTSSFWQCWSNEIGR